MAIDWLLLLSSEVKEMKNTYEMFRTIQDAGMRVAYLMTVGNYCHRTHNDKAFSLWNDAAQIHMLKEYLHRIATNQAH